MALLLNQTTGQVFGGAGVNHAPGLVPDPGTVAAATPYKFLRNDVSFSQVNYTDIAGNISVPINSLIYGSPTGTILGLSFGTAGQLLVANGSATPPSWLSQGSNGQVLTSGGSNTLPTWQTPSTIATPSFSLNTTVFTSSGTYTPTANMIFVKATAVGGGGGGGGAVSTLSQFGAGSGGGAGGIAIGQFGSGVIGASQIITIGGGGAGGVGTVTGTTGGVTTFGSGALLTANGGRGGVSQQVNLFNLAGGSGGTASGGYVNIQGNAGGPCYSTPSAAGSGFAVAAGFGAGGYYGGGPASNSITSQTNVNGVAATSYGAGGGGALAQSTSAGTVTGGNGFAGLIIIEETIFVP